MLLWLEEEGEQEFSKLLDMICSKYVKQACSGIWRWHILMGSDIHHHACISTAMTWHHYHCIFYRTMQIHSVNATGWCWWKYNFNSNSNDALYSLNHHRYLCQAVSQLISSSTLMQRQNRNHENESEEAMRMNPILSFSSAGCNSQSNSEIKFTSMK